MLSVARSRRDHSTEPARALPAQLLAPIPDAAAIRRMAAREAAPLASYEAAAEMARACWHLRTAEDLLHRVATSQAGAPGALYCWNRVRLVRRDLKEYDRSEDR